MDDLAEQVSALLAAYGERDRHIFTVRLGLDGGAPRSLESIGAALAISRERVRQIEHKLLDEIAAALSAPSIEAWLEARSDAAWATVSEGSGYLRRADLTYRRLALPADVRLLLALARQPVAAWLDRTARPFGAGWCDRSVSVRRLNGVASRLAQRLERRQNATVASLGQELDPVMVRIVLALMLDRPVRNGRLVPVRRRQRNMLASSAVSVN